MNYLFPYFDQDMLHGYSKSVPTISFHPQGAGLTVRIDPNVRLASFQFLNLPFELRCQIINEAISGDFFKPPSQSGGFSTGDKIEPHDFTISAAGLKCHFLKPFNLLSVNRQIRRESMAIMFQQSSACIHVDIPRYGGLSKVNTSVPGVLNTLHAYPLLCEMARKVTVIFRPESAIMSGPLVQVDGDVVPLIRQHLGVSVLVGLFLVMFGPIYALVKVASWAHRATPFQGRHADLRGLVGALKFRFKSRMSLKVIVYLDDLYFQDLKAIIGLLEPTSCSIAFEERWLQWHYPAVRSRVVGKYEADFKIYVEHTAEEAGNNLLSTVPPSLEDFEVDMTDDGDTRGNKIIGKRRRVWLEEDL